MNPKRALVLCPGRGSYGRDSLGSLANVQSDTLDAMCLVRQARKKPTPRELDAKERFSAKWHLAGENASILTAAISLADLDQLDAQKIRVVAACGNSMGWYTALGFTGVLDATQCGHLIDTMGGFQENNVIGGQILYPLVDEQWKLRPDSLILVASLVNDTPDLFWSLRLGGQAVLGGSEEALNAAMARLPAIEQGSRTYPLRLPMHAAFHTPHLAPTAQRAHQQLASLAWSAPKIPLIDGTGRIWDPIHADAHGIFTYTTGEQVHQTFDFTRMLRSALGAFAPEVIVLPGPGSNLGGAIAQVLISIGWQGIDSKDAFVARQNENPILLSLRWPDQRALALR